MSARSVPSGMRPSLSHSRRPISDPPRRPATAILTPLAPAFIDRWIDCFIAFLKAMRRLSWPAIFIATRCASSSGWRISLISSLTLRLVMAPICWRRISTLAPPLPMTIPGLAVWMVTVTWLMPRSISTPLTLALASRFSISWRILMSSWREAVYSLLSAYHFAVQVRETPRRKPYGWTLCPMSGLLIRDDDRDVGHGLVDGKRPTLCPRLEALDRGALVRDGIDDDQVLGRQAVVVLRVRGRALEDARDVGRSLLRHEAQRSRGLLDLHALDRLGDQAGLAGRAAEVLGGGGNAHDRPLLQRRRSIGVLAVPAIVAGRAELTEPMADHVLGHVDRDVLLAVVDRDRVADERREDDRRARPRLDDLLLVALVHLLDPAEETGLDERPLLD